MQFGFETHGRLSRDYKFSWGDLLVVDLRYQDIWRAHSVIKNNWIAKMLLKHSINIL